MTKRLLQTPKHWLDLDVCKNIFENFRKRLEFNEPIPPFETRFEGKLESILESVKQTYQEKYLNGTVLDASAAYFNQIIRGHPFSNGNKRMAVFFTHYFLLHNGVDFTLTYQEMYYFAVEIARSAESKNVSDKMIKELCKKIISEFTKEAHF